jgi:hypothetical protein
MWGMGWRYQLDFSSFFSPCASIILKKMKTKKLSISNKVGE